MPLSFLSGYMAGARVAGKQVAAASTTSAMQDAPETRFMDIEDRIDKMVIIVEAMWDLLQEAGVAPERLEAKIAELDATRRLRNESRPCPNCEAAIPSGLQRCQWCGHQDGQSDPLAAV